MKKPVRITQTGFKFYVLLLHRIISSPVGQNDGDDVVRWNSFFNFD